MGWDGMEWAGIGWDEWMKWMNGWMKRFVDGWIDEWDNMDGWMGWMEWDGMEWDGMG